MMGEILLFNMQQQTRGLPFKIILQEQNYYSSYQQKPLGLEIYQIHFSGLWANDLILRHRDRCPEQWQCKGAAPEWSSYKHHPYLQSAEEARHLRRQDHFS